jgi:hypothetical protein
MRGEIKFNPSFVKSKSRADFIAWGKAANKGTDTTLGNIYDSIVPPVVVTPKVAKPAPTPAPTPAPEPTPSAPIETKSEPPVTLN